MFTMFLSMMLDAKRFHGVVFVNGNTSGKRRVIVNHGKTFKKYICFAVPSKLVGSILSSRP